jgi:hypothetical protein
MCYIDGQKNKYSYLMFNGTSFFWDKSPGREADHSAPTRAEIKKTWSYTATLPGHDA